MDSLARRKSKAIVWQCRRGDRLIGKWVKGGGGGREGGEEGSDISAPVVALNGYRGE